MSDQPPAREAFDAIGASVADNLEQAFGTMADTLARTLIRQAELEEANDALSNRLESLYRSLDRRLTRLEDALQIVETHGGEG